MANVGNLQSALIQSANKGQKPKIVFATATGTATSALSTTSDLTDIVTDFHFKITMSSTSETVNIKGTIDGTNYEGALTNCVYVTSTGQLASPSTGEFGAGTYFIPWECIGSYRKFKWTKSSTSETGLVAYAFATLPGNS